MIAVDTNLLVYAHRPECPAHVDAEQVLRGLAEGEGNWGIPLHCLIEFCGVVSNPRLWVQPSQPVHVSEQVAAWTESPKFNLLTEGGDDWWPLFMEVLADARISGAGVHDARIAATCRYHGVKELWTADRDFGRFPWLRAINPIVRSG